MVLYGFRALFLSLQELGFEEDRDFERLGRSDWDVLCSPDEFVKLVGSLDQADIIEMRPIVGSRYFIKTRVGNYDIHIVKPGKDSSNSILYTRFNERGSSVSDENGNVFHACNLFYLFKIKQSHRFIRRGFSKTMEDYYRILDILEDLGSMTEVQSDGPLNVFYQKRFEETLVRADLAASHINLKQNKDGFFDTKGFSYVYDHDSIHRSVKMTDEPIYKKMLVPGEEVACSKERFDGLPLEQKRFAVLEESYVIAIERFLSRGASKSPKESFLAALEKVCTTLTKGWFRQFAYENYREVVCLYDDFFWEKFNKDLALGRIAPFVAE